jgi:hypothetical protein
VGQRSIRTTGCSSAAESAPCHPQLMRDEASQSLISCSLIQGTTITGQRLLQTKRALDLDKSKGGMTHLIVGKLLSLVLHDVVIWGCFQIEFHKPCVSPPGHTDTHRCFDNVVYTYMCQHSVAHRDHREPERAALLEGILQEAKF